MTVLASFGRIKVDVLRLLGSHRQITSNDVSSLIQNENREILDNYDWSARKAEGVINTFSTVTAGTVTVTISSAFVSGVSTSFTSNYVGRHIRIGSEEHFHEISSVTSAARLDLKTIWPTSTASAQSYTIFQNRFLLESDCEEIISVARDRGLSERSRSWLDTIDPDRTETASYPDVYSYRERTSSNILQVELWPVPTAKKAIRYEYLKSGDLVSNGDKPLYQPNVVKWKAGVAGALILYAKTGDPVWKDLAITNQGLYKLALQKAKETDQQKFSTRKQQRSRDDVYLRGDDYWSERDSLGGV
jgi:hypothetical protein